ITRMLLEKAGFKVSTASSGAECVSLVQAQQLAGDQYDVVLTDVSMAGLSGIEAAQQIRATPGLTHKPLLIALTGGVLPSQVREIKDAGIEDVLPKPFEIDKATRLLRNRVHEADRKAASALVG
ncbi:MAG: response regulator, partial [Limnobacter sp.]|nr:response regulator [Limnobacter sp.]